MQIGNESKEAETRVQSLISYKYPLIEKKRVENSKKAYLTSKSSQWKRWNKAIWHKSCKKYAH